MSPWWMRAHKLGVVGSVLFLVFVAFYLAAWAEYLF